MSRKSKREAAQAQSAPASYASSGGFELQVFDGQGHSGTMVFYRDGRGRILQKLRRGRDWHATLPQTHR